MKRGLVIIFVLALVLALMAAPVYANNTPGYWKNHVEAWDTFVADPPAPDDPFIGDAPEGFTWLNALGTPPKGNDPYWNLARAYAAAYLNGMAHWDNEAGDCVRTAGELLEDYGPGDVAKGTWEYELFRFWAHTLDNWNNEIWE